MNSIIIHKIIVGYYKVYFLVKMGGMSTFEFVPSSYKIRYVDSLMPSNITSLNKKEIDTNGRCFTVIIPNHSVETTGTEKTNNRGIEFKFTCTESDLTVGWLLSEVSRKYNDMHLKITEKLESKECEDKSIKDNHRLKQIVGLKTVEGILTLDYYLCHLENSLSPIKESTKLTVHFSNVNFDTKNEKINKNSFQYLKVIGCGGYSNVVLARKKDSGRMYAIKIIKKDKTYLNTNKNIYLAEANIMKKLSGLPFIVNLYYTFQTENELYFVMEPCIGGTLFYFMSHSSKGDLNDEVIRFYMAEIITALEKVHSKNIMYRDLKPENILIDVDGHIKLTDFGLSKQIRKSDETSMTFCGSPEYIPPEMLFGQEHSKAVDFYTLGCLLYELLIGFPPFHSVNKKHLYKRIMGGVLNFPKNIDPQAQDLMEWLLSKDPCDRPKEFSEIKQHPYFVNIHWGRIALKEAIPPWIPDHYTCHVPKRFTQIPLSHVFFKNTYYKESNRTSHNHREKEGVNSLKGVLVKDKNSNRQHIKHSDKIDDSIESLLYLKGFDEENESKQEECIRLQLESYFSNFSKEEKIIQQKAAPTMKTKCTDNYIETEEDQDVDEKEVEDEGPIGNITKYNCLSDSFNCMKIQFGRYASEKVKTPKQNLHMPYYGDTFESFNKTKSLAKTFTHHKPYLKARYKDDL